MGGFGDLETEEPVWMPTLIELEASGKKIQGQLKGRFKSPIEGKLAGENLRLETRLQGRKLTCDASREGEFLVGDCRFGDRPMKLSLTSSPPLTREQAAPYIGLYELAPGHHLAIAMDEILIAIDLETGWGRTLFHQGDDRFFAGPKITVPFPVERRLAFTRNAQGEVTALTLESSAGTVEAKRCCQGRSEPFAFKSAGTELRGTLHLPPGDGPFPAAVWIHGSGRSDRHDAIHFPAYLVREGFAVLAYDKRGIGESGGSYAMPDGRTFGYPFLARRAGDALAAVRALRQRPEVDADRVGLFGLSQAGWVAAQAAGSADIAFTVVLSGGATALSLEDKHSRWSGENIATGGTVEEVIARLRKEPIKEPGFRSHFANQKSPGLWLYGFKDRSNPSQLCAELIEDVAKAHGKDFTVVTFPNGNHALLEAKRGGYDEIGALEEWVPGMHGVISEWLREKVLRLESTND
ncbi:MAG: prolyl oligopeptidase family serine peptidase [Acidobacteriota bacterium]